MKESPAVLGAVQRLSRSKRMVPFFQPFSDASMIGEIVIYLFLFKDNPLI